MATPTLRVFVSSTMQDLKEHREALRDAVLRIGGVPSLVENFTATGEPIHEIVEQQLAKSDVAVLIVGYRYGATMPQSGKSWVEAEYEAARKQQKPCLIFMAAPDAEWPAQYFDQDQSNVQRFRERLSSENVVKYFRDPDDLRHAAAQVLAHWLATLEHTAETQGDIECKPRQVHVVRMLLSSPGDVADERKRVANAVFRFNQSAVEERGIFVKLILWEDMAPQIGPQAQRVINKQIGEYHLFIGLMWNRFGTPTEVAASGTKEEFDAALNAWMTTTRPWVTFYFCDRPANFTTPQQLEQKMKVVQFRSELNDKGIVRSFSSSDDFEDMVYRDLFKITALPDFQSMVTRMRSGG